MNVSHLMMQGLQQMKHLRFPVKPYMVIPQCIGTSLLRCSYTLSNHPFHRISSFPVGSRKSTMGCRTLRESSFCGSDHTLSSWVCNSRQELLQFRTNSIRRDSTLSGKSVVQALPSTLQPYLRLMRIDRPIGVWLVFLPCAWSISLAVPAGQLPDAKMLALFALGSFFMRGAGCIINDMWDKDFDARVHRTRDRPLASGELSRFRALCFLSIPLSISLSILLTFNWNTIILGACSMIPCILYPLMKRVTYWPQAFLGLTFNWGVVMGWSAVRGVLDWGVLPLYASCIAWTLVYDTIYAFQDKEDDVLIGVKSTALRFGDNTKVWLTGFNGLISAGLLSTGYLCEQTWPYYLGVVLFTSHLGHQIYSVDLSNPESCGQKFRSNRNLGLVFWALIMAANLLKSDDKNDNASDKMPDSEVVTLHH